MSNKDDSVSRWDAIDALDIAIERYDEIAEKYRKKADIERNDYMDMRDNAYEAQQLAQWLNELKYLREKIEQITIKPEQRWIPVTERLPEEDHWLGGSGKQFSDNVLISITNHEDEDAWSYISQTIDGEWALELPRHCEITAWMPLPEAYQGGEQDDR